MSDYDPSRNYPPNHLATGEGRGTGLFWLLFAIAVLGLIVLVGTFGNGSTMSDHPGGAGADPVALQPDPVPAEGSTVIE